MVEHSPNILAREEKATTTTKVYMKLAVLKWLTNRVLCLYRNQVA